MDDEKRLKPVTDASIAKNSRPSKAIHTFFSGNAKDVGRGIFNNVLIPSIKSTAETVSVALIKGFLYGDSGTYSSSSSGNRQNAVPYNRISEKRGTNSSGTGSTSYSYRSVYDYNDIEFRTSYNSDGSILPGSMKANDVLNGMKEAAREFGWCRVRDIYDLADIHDIGTSNDVKWGWSLEMLEKAQVIGGRDVYYLKLPRPVAID